MSSVMRFDEWQDSDGNPVASGVGGAFTAPGNILQVVSTIKTDTFSTTSTSYVDVTGLAVSITPSSTSSKIFVILNTSSGHSVGGTVQFQLVRDATDIAVAASGANPGSFSTLPSASSAYSAASVSHLDNPATTSSVTYKVKTMTNTGTMFVNRRGVNADRAGTSSITVMEVAV